MKTLKITDKAHKKLTEMIAIIYNDTGIKLTYSELIEKVSCFEHQSKNKKGVYNFDDK